MADSDKANSQALDDLRELLRAVGFYVRKRAPQEMTLRVYPRGFGSYPLLNPRFVESGQDVGDAGAGERLVFTVVSQRGSVSPESWLGNLSENAEWTYVPLGEDRGRYRYHGQYVFSVRRSSEPVPGAIDLASLRSPLLKLKEFLKRERLVDRRYWVVKGRPDRNGFESWLAPGAEDRWITASPPREWQPRDRLFFWEAAPATRIVGLGELTGVPARPARRGIEVNFGVRYLTSHLRQPVHLTEAREDPDLSDASFLKSGPAGTLFPLSYDQAQALLRLVADRNPEVTSVWPDLANLHDAPAVPDLDDLPDSAAEGRSRIRLHYSRERDPRLRHRKKVRVIASTGRLACEICGFDFAERYGDLGNEFCEVHHLRPLAEVDRSTRTHIDDLAIVCSNCHRMIHRDGGCRSLDDVRAACGLTSNLPE